MYPAIFLLLRFELECVWFRIWTKWIQNEDLYLNLSNISDSSLKSHIIIIISFRIK